MYIKSSTVPGFVACSTGRLKCSLAVITISLDGVCDRSYFSKLYLLRTILFCVPVRQSAPPFEEDSWRHRRLRSELKTIRTDPPEGIQATPLDRHCCHWQASITGPRGSPYEGGLFLLYLQIPHRCAAPPAPLTSHV